MRKLEFIDDANILLAPTLPKKTDSYTPISNKRILDLIEEECYKNNLNVTCRNYKTTLDNNKFIGQFDLSSNHSELGLRIVFRNSYDKSMSFGFAIGAHVFVCSNGMISGEVSLKRKHTGGADQEAEEKIKYGISLASETFERLIEDKDKMQNNFINQKINAELIGRLYLEKEVLNSIQLNIVKDQLNNSKSFKTIFDQEYSIWDMYNHCTYALKESHPSTFMSDHIGLHNFIKTII